ncbi:MAG: ABC transporter ATP-binding protein [Methylococcales bacterium]|jgi:ABC-type multidrug transport system fused ATPase/permease subunit|nr:ABC transporter ATP-binding protein [Methylococcales bacterium]MBT7445667.1 ABC transporter ATP-binding protein [Methylococcales bacterium]
MDWIKRAHRFGLSYQAMAFIIVMSLMTTFTEMFGVSVFLPIFQYMRLEGDVSALLNASGFWQYIINSFSWLGLAVSLQYLLAIAFTLFLLRQLFSYVRMIYISMITQGVIMNLRKKMFDRYLSANIAYHDRMPVGNLVNVMTTEINAAVIGIAAPLELLVYLLMAVGYLTILSFLSWEMTLASLVVLVVTGFVPKIWVKKSALVGRKLVDANTQMSTFLVERLKSPRLVRLSGTEKAEQQDFSVLVSSQKQFTVRGVVLQGRTDVVMEPVVIALSLVFLYVAYSVLHMNIEVIGLYLLIALRLMPVIKGIIMQWQKTQRLLGSIEAVEERLFTMQAEKEVSLGTVEMAGLKTGLALKNIHFSYPESGMEVLQNVSLTIPACQMTAIVGASGSGKSTLIDLLPALRTPQKGTVLVDNTPIGDIDLKQLRQSIAYAPQGPQIFNGSIAHHIRYGKPDASIDEIKLAAKLSGAADFIESLPGGYDAMVSDGAVNLSGGQRQRLDLARALVKQSDILILDEPTSNLDAESERAFHQALKRIRSETQATIVIVSHQLAGVCDAEQIVVLSAGAVEAIGTHDELLKESDWYSKAWAVQSNSA